MKEMCNNEIIDACISLNGFSDHHMITLVLNVNKTLRSNYYCHLNVKLLHDAFFCESFKVVWGNWKMKKLLFESLCQWWDVGKADIRLFCQSYAFHTSAMVKTTVNILQKDNELLEKIL